MQAWEDFLKQQEEELGAETVQKWLRSLKIERFDACNLYLQAADSFQSLWFEEHIRKKVNTLVNGNNKKIKIHLSTADESPSKKQTKNKSKKVENAAPAFEINFDELDPCCLFSNFIETEENSVAAKLLMELCQDPHGNPALQLGTFNPIYLYGSCGSGKTHLLVSTAHALKKKGLKVVYSRAESFTDHVVSAIRGGEMSRFREIYRNIDVLIVDDVQVFSRKIATQEEFFHTFNTLHIEGKQIILGANCSPQELQFIEPRLISRFEWGIALPLKTIEGPNLHQMLMLKTRALNFPLPEPIIAFLVQTFTSNPKALTRALEALILRLHLDARHPVAALTPTAVKTLLADLIATEQHAALTPQAIIQAVADHYGLKSEDVLGKSQKRECVLPRQLAMHLCREKLKIPFMKIGELFSRDHSTVISSVRQIQTALDQDNLEMAGALHAIQKKITT